MMFFLACKVLFTPKKNLQKAYWYTTLFAQRLVWFGLVWFGELKGRELSNDKRRIEGDITHINNMITVCCACFAEMQIQILR